MPVETDNLLGAYLKDRRARLDPAALGFPAGRRRTPGLRREEVAQRSNISPTWYTWLEQGRGGAPSADVLNRIAAALMLTDIEREHLFLLGLGRPPEVRYKAAEGVTPRLQRLLDAGARVDRIQHRHLPAQRDARDHLVAPEMVPSGGRFVVRHTKGDRRVIEYLDLRNVGG
jgi:transcriptional regulator with XRE-family HTH domain